MKAPLFLLLLMATAIGVSGCSPGGPSYDELAAEPVFAGLMPGATEIGSGGSDPSGNVEGGTYGFATRMFITDDDEAIVLAWHQDAYEADGWTPAEFSRITMKNGRFPEYAWERGDRVIGFGFPRPDATYELPAEAEGATTVYEVTIAYQPDE